MRLSIAGFLVLFAAGCAPRAAPRTVIFPSTPARSGAPLAAAPLVVSKSGAVTVQPVALVPPSISVVEPRADESLPEKDVRTHAVVLSDVGTFAALPGVCVALVLDQIGFRTLCDLRTPTVLGDLFSEGRDLGPGEHVLVAVAVGTNGVPLSGEANSAPVAAVRRFWVGPPRAPTVNLDGPMLVPILPQGTYNGVSAGSSVVLSFAVLHISVGGDVVVRATVRGPHAKTVALLTRAAPYALEGLESGDYDVELELVDRGAVPATPWARAIRTITVNLDAPAEAQRK